MAQEFNLEVIPVLPKALERLEEIANNLWYGWYVPARALFEQLDYELWIRVSHNPKLFLRNVDQTRLDKAAKDPLFLNAYRQVTAAFDDYLADKAPREAGCKLEKNEQIAYFCAEYGFHESLPVYSGGLGILAGDHCKTASDLRLPFVGIGLFYHLGYFSQHIDTEGNQQVTSSTLNTEHLPIKTVTDENGEELRVTVNIAGRTVWVKAWLVQVGHIQLYLLDTEIPQNTKGDAEITHQLYGGDNNTRIQQEIVLGIAGVRMLRLLGIAPTVWHMNEGHAAFLVLELLREKLHSGYLLAQAMEAVASSCVFTTHTPVPAGHDHFPQDLVMHYLGQFSVELGLSREEFLRLGCEPAADNHDFNMTTLAINLSRHMNGVSRIHGRVSSEICQRFWPQLEPTENIMSYVTNGVHISSFLARQWTDLFDKHLGADWDRHLCATDYWDQLMTIPDKDFWETHQAVKSRMLVVVRNALISQHKANKTSETHIEQIVKNLDPNNPGILTIGFARRFATYKRATLLLNNMHRLREIMLNTERPIVFIFAGKAHPADDPGKSLLKALYQLGNEPDFIGKLIVVQGYDMGLSRRLVSGVDVWLNNPVYPLEASGTSGMKAAVNAAINLSVLDGWWDEGYERDNGWGIRPSPHEHDDARRDQDDANTLYDILQKEVLDEYYDLGKYGYSKRWIHRAKRSMASVIPHFNMVRVLNEYVERFYIPASRHGQKMLLDNGGNALRLSEWKSKIREQWHGINVRQTSEPAKRLTYDESTSIQVAVHLNGLDPNDVAVELLLSRKLYHPEIYAASPDNTVVCCTENAAPPTTAYRFKPEHPLDNGEYLFTLEFQPDWCGDLSYKIRVFPYSELLSDAHDMGLMVWA
ncbi:MAG: alpha-glucan family phosphorylase [Thiotrichaceae bacterium]|nr:alpha-glucan family phosphorylase [Thiotrichaceae bacterium]